MATQTTKATKTTATAAPATNTTSTPVAERTHSEKRRTTIGVVVSNKMQKTIVVKVDRRVRDSMYAKYVLKSRRFKAHDEKNEANVGDRVQLVECRPLSKDKRWVLQNILRRAGQTAEANI